VVGQVERVGVPNRSQKLRRCRWRSPERVRRSR